MSGDPKPARRATIADIAERAGVSKGAVSYALNGQPGVSEATRARVLAIAARARLVPQPGGALALGRARARVRPRDRPPVADPRARAVLHGVHRRCRGGAVGPLGGAHDPARPRPRGGGRGLPAVVGRAACRRGHARRPARRRPARRRDRTARPAGGRRGRPARGRRSRRSGTTRPSRSARSSATSRRSGTSAWRGLRAWPPSSTTSSGTRRSWRPPPSGR